MVPLATVVYGQFGPIMALCKDSFWSIQTNHSVMYNVATDNSCIQYARKLFRQINRNFQTSPIIFELLYHLFTFHW